MFPHGVGLLAMEKYLLLMVVFQSGFKYEDKLLTHLTPDQRIPIVFHCMCVCDLKLNR